MDRFNSIPEEIFAFDFLILHHEVGYENILNALK